MPPDDHPDLREALKRCSPATYSAACKFRETGDCEQLRAVIFGVVERYVERDLRPKLQSPDNALRLREDLGLDSLTMMEIVMVAEDVFPISITNEELTRLCTLGDVLAFFEKKVRDQPALMLPNGATQYRQPGTDRAVPTEMNSQAAAPINRFAG